MIVRFAFGVAMLAAAACAAAQNYPSRPVRIVVPAAPGGTIDIITRILSQKLSESLGQQVIVENRAASATTIVEEYVARATPDGHTLMMAGTSRATNPLLHVKLSYDPLHDLTSISLVANSGNVLVVNRELPVRSVCELIDFANSRPAALFYGTAAFGSSGHLAAEMFNQMAGTKFEQVPYKGAAPALADLIAGQIQMTFDNIPVVIPHVRGGRLRALGVTSSARSSLLPEVPTIAQAGLAGYEMTARFGLCAPAKIPVDVLARVNAEIVRALKMPEVRERFIGLGFEPVGSSPQEYQRLIAAETVRLGEVIKAAGMKPQ